MDPPTVRDARAHGDPRAAADRVSACSRSGSSSRRPALPSALLNQIKRLAAFQNPEFYKKQSMRLSTALTPRVIACAEEFPEHIALPRGCLADLEDLLREHGVALVVDDQRLARRSARRSASTGS